MVMDIIDFRVYIDPKILLPPSDQIIRLVINYDNSTVHNANATIKKYYNHYIYY